MEKQCKQSSSSTSTSGVSHSDERPPLVCYTLFLYREELRRRKTHFIRLSKTKLHLTNELISKTVRNIHQCSVDDLKAISREMMFKKKLKTQVQRMRTLQKLGMCNVQPNVMTTEL